MPSAVSPDIREAIAALTARIERLEAGSRPVHTSPEGVGKAWQSRPEREVELAAVETRLGGYWAARLGIVSLVTGAAFAIAHGFDHFGPLLRALVGYASAAGLAGLGRRVMRRRERLGQILISGGLGIGYYTTYAIHHVPSVQLIASPEVGFALLAGSVIGIIAIAQIMRSETVAGLALFLGLHTGMVSQVGVFTLASGCLLGAGASYFMAKNRWVIVPLSTLVAVYSTLVTWLLGNPMTTGAGVAHPPDHLATALGFVALYYVIFAVAVARAPAHLNRIAASSFALLNWVGAAAISVFELAHHHSSGAELVLGTLAAASLLLALVSARRLGRGDAFHLHLALAAVSLALAAWASFDGAPLIACLCAVAAISAATARALGSPALRHAAAAIATIAVLGFVESAANPALAAAVIATLAIYERLDPSSDWVRRLIPVGGIGLVGLTCATALAPSGLVTASWIGVAAAIFVAGLVLRALHYRLIALAVFAVGFVRLFAHDLAAYAAVYRIASFLIAGALLLGVAYVYTRRAGSPTS